MSSPTQLDQSSGPPLVQQASRSRSLSAAARERAISALRRLTSEAGGTSFRLIALDGATTDFGAGEPTFTIRVQRQAGLDALASLDALTIAHAYMGGDIDMEGD